MAMSFNNRGYFYFISKYNLMKISKYNSGGGWGRFWLTLVIIHVDIHYGNKLLFFFTVIFLCE